VVRRAFGSGLQGLRASLAGDVSSGWADRPWSRLEGTGSELGGLAAGGEAVLAEGTPLTASLLGFRGDALSPVRTGWLSTWCFSFNSHRLKR